jgi:SAM-dependent methyltransferase
MPHLPDASITCSICGSAALRPHLAVAATLGEQGLIPTTDAFGTALADIARCAACGHMQLDRMPSQVELGEAYGEAASDDYVDEEAGQRATARAALERIERHTGGPGRQLDLGCWVGFLLAEARERGRETLGVEPSTFASDYARTTLGLEVLQADLLEADLPRGAFDAVVLGDVIEHLIDPAAALVRIRELLAPGGVVYMALPDAGSRLAQRMGARWWSVIPTHVHYFTRGSMRTLLERGAWRLEYLGTAPKAFSVRYYLGRVGGYSPPLAGALVSAASAVGLADRLWAPDFRDRMAVVARSV